MSTQPFQLPKILRIPMKYHFTRRGYCFGDVGPSLEEPLSSAVGLLQSFDARLLDFQGLQSRTLGEGTYCIKIAKDSLERKLGPFQMGASGELAVHERVEFKIPSGELKRDSKCVIQIYDQEKQRCEGSFEFMIMNYKNYSKSSFKVTSAETTVAILQMTMNISSGQSKQSDRHTKNELRPPSLVQDRRKKSQQMQPQSVRFQQEVAPQIKVSSPVQEIKLICPSQAVSFKEPKSMFGAFENSGIVIATNKNFEQHKPLSSMGELFEKKSKQAEDHTLKVPVQESLMRSCKLSPLRAQKDSRYCKEIQENLDHLSALDQQSNRLSYSRSPLKGEEEEYSIFDTLSRMKDKFEKIHEHQEILNDEPYLDQLIEVNDEGDTEEREKLNTLNDYSHFQGLISVNTEHVPSQQNYEFGRNTLMNLQVHSAASHIYTQSNEDECKNIVKTVDFRYVPQRPAFRIHHCYSMKLVLNDNLDLRSEMQDRNSNKRYLLSKLQKVSEFSCENEEKEKEASKLRSLTQSYLNFQIEEESLKRVSYIKLNKISHLSRAADISKRRNNFLIKANEELKIAQRLAEQKLDISKKIISEKEDMLNHEFESLREHMKTISNNLSLKNEESVKREEKVRSLQGLVEQYVRDINSLKSDLKFSYSTIKDLKCLLALRDDAEAKGVGSKKLITEDANPFTLKELFKKGNEEAVNPFGQFFQSEKRANSTSKTFVEEKKVRKYSSIDNTINGLNFEENNDKSVDLSNRTGFRKFTHSKTAALTSGYIPQTARDAKQFNKMDLVFEKLTGLFTGDSGNRLLKNL